MGLASNFGARPDLIASGVFGRPIRRVRGMPVTGHNVS
jgi:hypothetical protein